MGDISPYGRSPDLLGNDIAQRALALALLIVVSGYAPASEPARRFQSAIFAQFVD
jgi:hypothetical protein